MVPIPEVSLDALLASLETRTKMTIADLALLTNPETLIEEGVDWTGLALARFWVQDSFEGLITLGAVTQVSALSTEGNRAQFALASEGSRK